MNEQQFIKVADLPKFEPALTVGGFRHIQHHYADKLEEAGVTCRFGRKLLINLPKLREFIANGGLKDLKKVSAPYLPKPVKGYEDDAN